MTQILWILVQIVGIVLLVVLGLLVLLHLLLIPRVGIHLWAKQADLQLKIQYGFLRLLVYPRPPKSEKKGKKKKPARKKKEKPAPAEQAEKPPRTFNWKALDWGDTICWLLDVLLQLKNTLQLSILRTDVTLATGDAAKTGQLLGYLSAGVSAFYAFLMEHFKLKTCRIVIDGDFEGNKTVYDVEVNLSLRLIVLEWVLLRNLPKLYRIYKTLTKTEAETT